MRLQFALDVAHGDFGGAFGVAGQAGELLDVDLWSSASLLILGDANDVPLARFRSTARLELGPPSRGGRTRHFARPWP